MQVIRETSKRWVVESFWDPNVGVEGIWYEHIYDMKRVHAVVYQETKEPQWAPAGDIHIYFIFEGDELSGVVTKGRRPPVGEFFGSHKKAVAWFNERFTRACPSCEANECDCGEDGYSIIYHSEDCSRVPRRIREAAVWQKKSLDKKKKASSKKAG